MRNHEVLALFLLCGDLSAVLYRFALLHPVRHEVSGRRSDVGGRACGSVHAELRGSVLVWRCAVRVLGARRLILGGLVCAAAASALLGIFGPGAGWLAFNGSLILLGIGVGAVIPTISTRAIEAAGLERASLVSGIVFMCQLAGAALLLAVSTAIFSAASARDLERSVARDGIVLAPDQRQAVEEVIAGARNRPCAPASDRRGSWMIWPASSTGLINSV